MEVKFYPRVDRKTGVDRRVLYARVDDAVYKKIKEVAEEYSIGINDLYRQMIFFAFENLADRPLASARTKKGGGNAKTDK